MIDTLSTNINPIKKSIDTLWIEEVQKRKEQIESGNIKLVNGKKVFEKLALKLSSL